ncbi:hypothetical protein SSYRP_v1c05240 [Spiroplasma syrphidicola EA-1]|uniref:Uncharacterized protein n=1 Tax=Spiroplasma syrphidicola EA-1 TaxID=1276229 RepID=R4UDZ4_9MOLU|nr:hypothetical protein [Spiroplasma syrphidicola]AGM26114.1 hypothetical protein SSYRP_v1c05240 [Spiroplasma syrphidicola EA-1]
MEKDYIKYYNWANNKWAKKWRITNSTRRELFRLKAKIHYIPLWQPAEVELDLDNQQLVVPKNLVSLISSLQLPKTDYYMFKYNNINNLLLTCHYIVINYTKIVENKLLNNEIDLRWSTTYGAYFFKKITNYLIQQDIAIETYRTARIKKQQHFYRAKNKKLFY